MLLLACCRVDGVVVGEAVAVGAAVVVAVVMVVCLEVGGGGSGTRTWMRTESTSFPFRQMSRLVMPIDEAVAVLGEEASAKVQWTADGYVLL